MIDKGIVAKEGCAEAPGGDGDRGAGASLLDGFVDRCEMNTASERKHVFEDEHAVCIVGSGRDAVAAQETL